MIVVICGEWVIISVCLCWDRCFSCLLMVLVMVFFMFWLILLNIMIRFCLCLVSMIFSVSLKCESLLFEVILFSVLKGELGLVEILNMILF